MIKFSPGEKTAVIVLEMGQCEVSTISPEMLFDVDVTTAKHFLIKRNDPFIPSPFFHSQLSPPVGEDCLLSLGSVAMVTLSQWRSGQVQVGGDGWIQPHQHGLSFLAWKAKRDSQLVKG